MPRKYYRRKDKFLAARFSADRFEELRELTRGRLFYSATMDKYLLFTHGNEFIMTDGDYIVESRGIGGGGVDFEVWTADVFESLFEIIPGQDDDDNAPSSD